MALISLTNSQKMWHFNLVVIMVLGILFIANANPTSETFMCNQDKVCSLKTTYILPPLNRTKVFKLNVGSCLEPMEYYHSSKNGSWYTYNLGLDNREGKTIKLFKVESATTYGNDDKGRSIYDEVLKYEISSFERYKKNPESGFLAESPAESGNFALWLYTWVIVMTILMIWNILDKNKGTV